VLTRFSNVNDNVQGPDGIRARLAMQSYEVEQLDVGIARKYRICMGGGESPPSLNSEILWLIMLPLLQAMFKSFPSEKRR
jgi:hypothetical protein